MSDFREIILGITLRAIFSKDHDVVLVYQIGAGIGYNVSQPLTIFLDYRYFDPSDPHMNSTAGAPADIETLVHNVGIGLRYNFTE